MTAFTYFFEYLDCVWVKESICWVPFWICSILEGAFLNLQSACGTSRVYRRLPRHCSQFRFDFRHLLMLPDNLQEFGLKMLFYYEPYWLIFMVKHLIKFNLLIIQTFLKPILLFISIILWSFRAMLAFLNIFCSFLVAIPLFLTYI